MVRSFHSLKAIKAIGLLATMVTSSIFFSLLMTVAIASDIDAETSEPFPNADMAGPLLLVSVNLAQANIDSTLSLSDVSPDHWGYTAVQRLVEDYGCLVGYPDGTFRGDELLTRYEFAAALNACLDRMIELTPVETDSDRSSVRAIQQDLQRQLDCLTGDVEQLEGSTDGVSVSDSDQCAGL